MTDSMTFRVFFLLVLQTFTRGPKTLDDIRANFPGVESVWVQAAYREALARGLIEVDIDFEYEKDRTRKERYRPTATMYVYLDAIEKEEKR